MHIISPGAFCQKDQVQVKGVEEGEEEGPQGRIA